MSIHGIQDKCTNVVQIHEPFSASSWQRCNNFANEKKYTAREKESSFFNKHLS